MSRLSGFFFVFCFTGCIGYLVRTDCLYSRGSFLFSVPTLSVVSFWFPSAHTDGLIVVVYVPDIPSSHALDLLGVRVVLVLLCRLPRR